MAHRKILKANQRSRIGSNDSCICKADQRDEQADTHRNGFPQADWNRLDDSLTDAGK